MRRVLTLFTALVLGSGEAAPLVGAPQAISVLKTQLCLRVGCEFLYSYTTGADSGGKNTQYFYRTVRPRGFLQVARRVNGPQATIYTANLALEDQTLGPASFAALEGFLLEFGGVRLSRDTLLKCQRAVQTRGFAGFGRQTDGIMLERPQENQVIGCLSSTPVSHYVELIDPGFR